MDNSEMREKINQKIKQRKNKRIKKKSKTNKKRKTNTEKLHKTKQSHFSQYLHTFARGNNAVSSASGHLHRLTAVLMYELLQLLLGQAFAVTHYTYKKGIKTNVRQKNTTCARV